MASTRYFKMRAVIDIDFDISRLGHDRDTFPDDEPAMTPACPTRQRPGSPFLIFTHEVMPITAMRLSDARHDISAGRAKRPRVGDDVTPHLSITAPPAYGALLLPREQLPAFDFRWCYGQFQMIKSRSFTCLAGRDGRRSDARSRFTPSGAFLLRHAAIRLQRY